MAARVGSLYVSLSANTAGLVKGLAAAMKAVDRFAKETKKIAADVGQLSMVVTAAAGAALKLASDVNGPTKAAMDDLTTATKQAAVPVAQMLIPAVQELTKELRTAGQYIAGLSPEMKGHVATAAKWGVELLVASKVIGSLSGVVSAFAGVASGLFSMLAGVGLATIGTIVASIAIGIASVVALHAAWRTNFLGLKDITDTIIENMKGAFLGLFTFLVSGWETLIDALTIMLDNWLRIIDTLQKKTGANLIDVKGMRSGVMGLMGDLRDGSFITDALKFGKSAGASIVDGMGSELKMMGGEIKDALKGAGIDLDSIFSFKKGNLASVGKPMTAEQQNVRNEWAQDNLNRLGLNAGGKRFGPSMPSEMQALDPILYTLEQRFPLVGLAAEKLSQEFVWSSEVLKDMRSDALEALKEMPISALPAGPTTPEAAGRVGADFMARINDGGGQSELMSAVEKAAEATKFNRAIDRALGSIADGITTAGQVFAGKFLGKMGELGSIASEAINAGMQGGPWAALATVVAELLTRTKAFESVVGTGNRVLEMLVKTAEPLMQALEGPLKRVLGIVYLVQSKVLRALQPVFDLVGVILDAVTPPLVALSTVFTSLAPLLSMLVGPVVQLIVGLKPLFMLVFELVKVISFIVLLLSSVFAMFMELVQVPIAGLRGLLGMLGKSLEWAFGQLDGVINGFFSGITTIWNTVVEALASAVDAAVYVISATTVTNGGDEIRKLKGDGSVTSAMGDLAKMTWDTAGAMADFGAEVNATTSSFAESLSNVPTGFKTALARFNAETPAGTGKGFNPWDPMSGLGNMLPGQGSGGGVTITGDVYVTAGSTSELMAGLRAEGRKKRFRDTGNPYP